MIGALLRQISCPEPLLRRAADEDGGKERLLLALKREVKLLMQQSVSRRSLPLSNSVALVAVVDQCLIHGLRRSILQWEETTSVTLLNKVAKHCVKAEHCLQQMNKIREESLHRQHRFQWIQLALFDHSLVEIVEAISHDCAYLYEDGALCLDVEACRVFVDLLVGPCAIPFTNLANNNHRRQLNEELDELDQSTANELVEFVVQLSPMVIIGQVVGPCAIPFTNLVNNNHRRQLNEELDELYQSTANELVDLVVQLSPMLDLGPCAIPFTNLANNNHRKQLNEELDELDQSTANELVDLVVQLSPMVIKDFSSLFQLDLGPCAIPFTNLANNNHRKQLNEELDEIDQSTANELVRRHALLTSHSSPPNSPRRPGLSMVRRGQSLVLGASVSNGDEVNMLRGRLVHALHQNSGRSRLLYGKNNVKVSLSIDQAPIKGYLALNQGPGAALYLKWTPNQLMHSSSQPDGDNSHPDGDNSHLDVGECRQALSIALDEVIYIHVHRSHMDNSGMLVLVSADGLQAPPLHMASTQHLVSFLSVLDSALAPFHRLDPPLWINEESQELIFPRLRRRTSTTTSGENDDQVVVVQQVQQEPSDFVFRIARSRTTDHDHDHNHDNEQTLSTNNVASIGSVPASPSLITNSLSSPKQLIKENLAIACISMRHQILSRAFHGWLTYCRHLNTIRTRLAGLIRLPSNREEDILDVLDGREVNEEFWTRCRSLQSEALEREFYSRVYDGGVEEGLRDQVWPYLLKAVEWKESVEEKRSEWTILYQETCNQWRLVETFIRLRDKAAFKAARAQQGHIEGEEEEEEVNDSNLSSTITTLLEPDEQDILFATNTHRIDKDIERCDRVHPFFAKSENLVKLSRVMYSFVWRRLDLGYYQGMCDLAAPLLVCFDGDEVLTLACFSKQMERIERNFPSGTGMDINLDNMRALLQVMDPEIFDLICSDSTHLYFCYRWFLLDFKREFRYDDVFLVWETLWAASHLVSEHFQLFIALSLITSYRHILMSNEMEFTDVIKFFNEMAEHHDAPGILQQARLLLHRLQQVIIQLPWQSRL